MLEAIAQSHLSLFHDDPNDSTQVLTLKTKTYLAIPISPLTVFFVPLHLKLHFWTNKGVYPIEKSHLNAAVADTQQWEHATAYYIDNHPITEAFVKNERLDFSIPYLINNQEHDYEPDFIIRLNSPKTRYVIFETKGYIRGDVEPKRAAAERWCRAVNADGRFGHWEYTISKLMEVVKNLNKIQQSLD